MPAMARRGLAGAATAALTWWLTENVLLARPSIAPAAAALLAAVLVARAAADRLGAR